MSEKYSSVRRLDDIEQLIDHLGVATLLQYIADVCDANGNHVELELSDHHLAKTWRAAATTIYKMSVSKTVKKIP